MQSVKKKSKTFYFFIFEPAFPCVCGGSKRGNEERAQFNTLIRSAIPQNCKPSLQNLTQQK